MAIKTKMSNVTTNVYILLDRSGSMSSRWAESIKAINGYVEGLENANVAITLAVFDSQGYGATGGLDFKVMANHISPARWKDGVVFGDIAPRGGTPLYDAIGKIADMAEGSDRAVLVIMTDGEENTSTKMKREDATKVLDALKAKDHQVVFLGADFDAFSQASHINIGAAFTLNTSAGNYAAATQSLSARTMDYAATGTTFTHFTDAERKAAIGKA